eukprot:gene28707-biopygen32625
MDAPSASNATAFHQWLQDISKDLQISCPGSRMFMETGILSTSSSALTDQFTSAVSAKDASIADLVRRLAASSAATEAALANASDLAERQELVNSHYALGRDLGKSRQEVSDLQAAYTLAAANSTSAMDAMRTALEANERDLTRSQTELAPLRAENARLAEVVAQLTRENIDFGKRPVAAPAAPSAPALTQADVTAIVAAHLAALTRNETGGEPMDTENDPRGSTSDALFVGTGNGRTVGRKHALPQSARQDDIAPLDPISACKQALMRGRQAKATPSYAKAAKTDGLLYYHSADHPIAPYADAKLAVHLTEYADGLLLDCEPEDIVNSLQAIDDVRDHMTRLFTAAKMRKQNWMLAMPLNIKDIVSKDAALKGTKLLPHYPAAEANDDKMDETLPRAPDRQVRDVGAPVLPDYPISVSAYISSDEDIADTPGSPRQAPPVRPPSDRAPRAPRSEPPPSPARPSTEPPVPVRPRAKRAAAPLTDTPSSTRQARAALPLPPDAPPGGPDGPGSLPPLAPHSADRAPRHGDRDSGA